MRSAKSPCKHGWAEVRRTLWAVFLVAFYAALPSGRTVAADHEPMTKLATPASASAATAPAYLRLVSRGEMPPERGERAPKIESVPTVRFSKSGTRLLTAYRKTVQVWAVPAMEPVAKPLPLADNAQAFDFSADGEYILTVDAQDGVRVWRVGANVPLWTRRSERGFGQAQFTPDGRSVLVVERNDRFVRLLDTATSKETLTIDDATSRNGVSIAVTRDGTRVVTSSLGPDRVWALPSGKPVSILKGNGIPFAISPTGDRVAGQAQAGEASIVDAATGQLIVTIPPAYRRDKQVANVMTLAFSPDGRRLATSVESYGVRVWDATTGQAVTDYFPHSHEVATEMLFTSDGQQLILPSLGFVNIWDLATSQCVAEIEMKKGWPQDPAGIAVSNDGRFIAVNFGGTVELWERRGVRK